MHWVISVCLFVYSSPSITVYVGIRTPVSLLVTFALSARGLGAILILALLCEGLIIRIQGFYPNVSPDFCAPSFASRSPPPRPPKAAPTQPVAAPRRGQGGSACADLGLGFASASHLPKSLFC